MNYDVTQNRKDYIGGSDIPIIMGLSPFKSRWTLLQEKAGLIESTFQGNRYTEYGNIIEPQIRAHINRLRTNKFEPNRVIHGDIRCHTDGFNGDCVLEIKSTSHIYETVGEYKIYLVQLLKYMEENHVTKGILAVYERPEDFNTDFDKERLQVFNIVKKDHVDLLKEVNAEIDRFREDLAKLKSNPLLTEQDFFHEGEALILLSNKVMAFENQIAAMKETERQLKEAKKALYEEMLKHDVKSWETPNGTKITRVDSVPPTEEIVQEFDLEAFRCECPVWYNMYLRDAVKKTNGKSGYVKLTVKQ